MIVDIHKELEEEYNRFIEFGGLLDRKMRRYLVQYLQNKFDPDRHIVPELKDKYYRYFEDALDDIFLIEGLQDILQQNSSIKKRVILDTIYWMKKSYKDVRTKHPYEDEQQRLSSWSITPMKAFLKRRQALPIYLSSIYRRDELDTQFYKVKFDAVISSDDIEQLSAEDRKQLDLLVDDILAKWDALLYAKILVFQLEKFKEEKEAYIDFLNQKVVEYNKLRDIVEPFSEYFGWDLSRKLWKKTSFDLIESYRNLLDDEDSVRQLADLLGSMREAEIEMEEETFEKTIIKQEWVKDEMLKSEIVGVDSSDRLTDMLSSEAGLLSDSDTESYFLKKYADKKLLTFRYEDKRLVKSVDHIMEVNQRVKQKEKGPFIVCVDTSESMDGTPEKIAKVMTMAILKMSMNQNRRAFLINFSTGIQTLDLYNIADSIDEIAAFLKMSFYGGTDATLALYEALKQLDRADYEDADILMVSDFIMYKLGEDVKQQISHYQINRNTQFHALAIGDQVNNEVLNYFDTNWQYNPKEKGIIRALSRGLKDIGDRM
ncbi:MAG: VWA domain-containing protein [Saprospiraceae bacterium]|nr:VWA domain-containing protein [Saprospiraceae bacterium]